MSKNQWQFAKRAPVVFKDSDVKKSFPDLSLEEARKHYRALTVMAIYDRLKNNHEFARGMVVSYMTSMMLSNWKEFIIPLKEKTEKGVEGVVVMGGDVYSPFVQIHSDTHKDFVRNNLSHIENVNDWDESLITSMLTYGDFREQVEALGHAMMKVLDTSPLYTQMIKPLGDKLKAWQEQYESLPVGEMREKLQQEQMELLLDWDENQGFFEPFNNLAQKDEWFKSELLTHTYYKLVSGVLGIPFNILLFLESIRSNQWVICKIHELTEEMVLDLSQDHREFSNEQLDALSQIAQNPQTFEQEICAIIPAYKDTADWSYLSQAHQEYRDLLGLLDELIAAKQSA